MKMVEMRCRDCGYGITYVFGSAIPEKCPICGKKHWEMLEGKREENMKEIVDNRSGVERFKDEVGIVREYMTERRKNFQNLYNSLVKEIAELQRQHEEITRKREELNQQSSFIKDIIIEMSEFDDEIGMSIEYYEDEKKENPKAKEELEITLNKCNVTVKYEDEDEDDDEVNWDDDDWDDDED